MTIDVVIPTYKPDEKYDALLRMLAKQTYPVNRIIVINTEKSLYGNHPDEPENLELYHIQRSEFDHGGTRNQALRMSESDLVMFLTQDAIPENTELVKCMVECFADETVACAYGRQLPAKDCSLIEQYTRQFNYPSEGFVKTRKDLQRLGIKTYFCSDVCAVYRRQVYEKLGGFPLKTIFNEDMIFASKVIGAGYGIAYCAKARVIHSHNYTGKQQFQRNFDMAVSQADHPEVFEGLPAEKEGVRMVAENAKWLVKSGHFYLIPRLIYVSGCKYLGYRMGKKYKKLPEKLVRFCSMNKNYWSEI